MSSILESIGLKPLFNAEFHIFSTSFGVPAGTTVDEIWAIPNGKYYVMYEVTDYSAPQVTTVVLEDYGLRMFRKEVLEWDKTKVIPPKIFRRSIGVRVTNNTEQHTNYVGNIKGFFIDSVRIDKLIKASRKVIEQWME